MRVVVALGGNALLRRGEPMTIENQRENVALACDHLAPLAERARAGDLPRQRPPDRAAGAGGRRVRAGARLPARRARRRDPGHDRLPRRAGARQPPAVREAARHAAHDDRGRPRRSGLRRPDASPSGRSTPSEEAEALAAEQGWTFRPDGDAHRRVVPSPRPKRIFEQRQIRWLLEHGCVVICAGGGGIPTAYEPDGQLRGVEAVIDKDHASGLLARDIDADVFVMATDAPRCVRRLRHAGAASDHRGAPGRAARRAPPRVRGRARCCRRSTAACDFARATGQGRGHRRAGRHRAARRRHGRHPDRHRRRRRHLADPTPPDEGSTDDGTRCPLRGRQAAQVMVHRPGLEHTRLTPSNAEELLFDDVLWVKRAKEEHDAFCEVMRDRGVEVFQAETLLAEALVEARREGLGRDHILNERQVGIGAADAGPGVGRRRRRPPRSPTSSSAGSPGATSSGTSGWSGSPATRPRCCCRRCRTSCSSATRRAGSSTA